MNHGADQAVTVTNRSGGSGCLLVCDHASNWMPAGYGALGLPPEALRAHTAWDPGALAVAQAMSAALDAPLVASRISRLVIDCNRAQDARDLIPETAEGSPVPGNAGLGRAERVRRLRSFHQPFHDAIDALIDARARTAPLRAVVSVHSFTPILFGVARPWTLGILHDADTRLADPMIARLQRDRGIVLGRNQPYSPADGVYYTLGRHGDARGLATAMIEIRNDQIADAAGVALWADRLSAALREALAAATGG